MAQSTTVMAFRKRLKSYGYTNIEIYKIRGYIDLYKVRAIEPLSGRQVEAEYTVIKMHNSFR